MGGVSGFRVLVIFCTKLWDNFKQTPNVDGAEISTRTDSAVSLRLQPTDTGPERWALGDQRHPEPESLAQKYWIGSIRAEDWWPNSGCDFGSFQGT